MTAQTRTDQRVEISTDKKGNPIYLQRSEEGAVLLHSPGGKMYAADDWIRFKVDRKPQEETIDCTPEGAWAFQFVYAWIVDGKWTKPEKRLIREFLRGTFAGLPASIAL